jgi:hypothetical protein
MNQLNFELHQARLSDLQREAERDHLAQEALSGQMQPVNPLVSTAMVALGRQFVKFGERLQAQYDLHNEINLAPAE